MLPRFDDFGNLPPGIHLASEHEIGMRFGHGTPERVVAMRELSDLIRWARENRVRRLIVNGSFVADKLAPNDVDIVVLPAARATSESLEQLGLDSIAWPFLQIIVAANEDDFENWALDDFATDRLCRAKGVVEVVL